MGTRAIGATRAALAQRSEGANPRVPCHRAPVQRLAEDQLERERIAHRAKHWVRLATACNSRCLFCLDADTPRNLFVPRDDVRAELERGLGLGADKVILSGGEASLHPEFHEIVAEARTLGYDRVQTVTNGWRFAERDFLRRSVDAGLGEITYSLHGDTPALHDTLTRTEGAFARILMAIARSVRERALITNVDVVINKMNVGRLDRIVELAIELGVREFDLLHVIPQANAYEFRDQLFYDVREHLPVLHKVFRLNRHPGFHIWTNRFPVHFLEGLEDLIQDPHKMLDEVNGRRFQVRRYLDEGRPLDCRQPERCVHCFIEPFCSTMDRVAASMIDERVDLWVVGEGAVPAVLPFGARAVQLRRSTWAEVWAAVAHLGPEIAVVAQVAEGPPAEWPLVAGDEASRVWTALVDAHTLPQWLLDGSTTRIEVPLDVETAPILLAERTRVEALLGRLRIVQPTHERMESALRRDVRDPRRFFEALDLPVVVTGLPPCALGPATFAEEDHGLGPALFDAATGRLDSRALADHHITARYRGRSARCEDCAVSDRCEGLPIQMVRDQGLRLCRPPTDDERAGPAFRSFELARLQPLPSLRRGTPPLPPTPSMLGFPSPGRPEADPLSTLSQRKADERARRRLVVLPDNA